MGVGRTDRNPHPAERGHRTLNIDRHVRFFDRAGSGNRIAIHPRLFNHLRGVEEGVDFRVGRCLVKPDISQPLHRRHECGIFCDHIAIGHEAGVGRCRILGRLRQGDGDLRIGRQPAEARVHRLQMLLRSSDVAIGLQADHRRGVVFLRQGDGDVVVGGRAGKLLRDLHQPVVGGVEIENDAVKLLQIEIQTEGLVELLIEIDLKAVNVFEVFLDDFDGVDDRLDNVG